MACDLCGRDAELVKAEIESSVMMVCNNCASFGKVLERSPKKVFVRKPQKNVEEDMIVENYAEIIRKARQKRGIKQEKMAKIVGEKESVVHKIESGKLEPSFSIARKLEAYLGVKLIEKYEGVTLKKGKKDGGMTIGDVIRLKGK